MLLSACGSTWILDLDGGGECIPRPFFFDGDGDGWGTEDDAHPRQMLCQADVANQITSRNDRDCDDLDDQITGRVGAVCPGNLTTGATEFVGLVGAESEFLAVLPSTETIWPEEAAMACELGWGHDDADGNPGAWLATFDDLNQVGNIQDAITDAGVTAYAGFIGVDHIADPAAWAWEDGSALALTDFLLCTGVLPDEGRADPFQRLALILPDGETNWCLGTPDDAGVYEHDTIPEEGLSPDIYAPLFGHFICERAIPDPDEFQMPPPTEEEGE